MLRVLQGWIRRYFSDPEAVLLFTVLLTSFLLIVFLGKALAPVLASIVFAYLLNSVVNILQKFKIPRLPAVLIVYIGFLGLFLLGLLVLLPLLWRQLVSLFNEIPGVVHQIESGILSLDTLFSGVLSKVQTQFIFNSLLQDLHRWGQTVITASIASIPSVITWLVYLILVPLMVFFFLKDKEPILNWAKSLFPKQNKVLSQVWSELYCQIGNYVNGKVLEIFLVGTVTYLILIFFDIRYPLLLAALVGFSVIIPYVGAAVTTIPIAIVAYLQFGWTPHFFYVLLVYGIIQFVDGNILVPLLFSEAVNLHPVTIIVSILVFGALWGFWGVFFAIPLATLVRAVLRAWPQHPPEEQPKTIEATQ